MTAAAGEALTSPLLLVIAAAKLKIGLRKGDFAAEVELSLAADLPRLKEAIQNRLERAKTTVRPPPDEAARTRAAHPPSPRIAARLRASESVVG
ncbi:MAG: hypothetical protein HQL39_11680 [Alphaproteobacteria bacterium]|nr:hypothetical protein [Alphaproteobacteria bacterium]